MLKIISGLFQAGASALGLLQAHQAAQKIKAPTHPQQNSTPHQHALFPGHEAAHGSPSISPSVSATHRAPLQFTSATQGAANFEKPLVQGVQGLMSALRLPLVTDALLNTWHASLAHPRAPGPEIEQVLPHTNRNEPLRGQPNVLPPALRHRATEGFAQHSVLGNNFRLPGYGVSAQPRPVNAPGYAAHRADPREGFLYAKPRPSLEHQGVVAQIDEILKPAGANTIALPSSRHTSPLDVDALGQLTQINHFPEEQISTYVYPEPSAALEQSSPYGIYAVHDLEEEVLRVQIDLQSQRPGHVAPVDGHTAMASLLSQLEKNPESIALHASELEVPQVKELAELVNNALQADQLSTGFVGDSVIHALSERINALPAALAQGYRLVGMFDTSEDGPGLVLVKENRSSLH